MNMSPDICFVVNTLSLFLTDMRHVHLIATKHVPRYLKGTIEYGIKYVIDHKINLHGHVYSDCSCNATNKKSTSSFYFSLGSSMISWFSRKNSSAKLSTNEVEYIAS